VNTNGSPNAVNSTGLSVEDNVADIINIYPNPVKNILYIGHNGESYDVEIYSLLGQPISTAFDVNQVDVSSFNQGIYLVKIKTENKVVVKRIMKL
jgi:hypothetical protein